MTAPVTIASLAEDRIWVAWQTEDRADGKPTKVPYAPDGRKAKANAPTTWGTRAQAETMAANLEKPYGAGGIGLEFTNDENGRSIGGIDFDSCRDPETETIASWAAEVAQRLDTYCEISPSNTGIKAFFTFATADLPALKDAIAPAKYGKQFKRGGGDHPPAIELYLANRYFAVTDRHLKDTPEELRQVSLESLLWLIQDAGPRFAVGKAKAKQTEHADSSRSAIAFRAGTAQCRDGASFDEMCAALLADPETAEWTREKGSANDGRELRGIWDAAQQSLTRRERPKIGWLADAQTDSHSEPRANLFNTMLALRDDPRICDLFARDEMLRCTILTNPVPAKVMQANGHAFELRPVGDDDVSALQELLQAAGLEKLGKDVVHQAVDLRAAERSFHPIRKYLEALVWDGQPRLAGWLTTYMGAEDIEYHRSIGCMFFVALVARVYQPGCQCDYMVVFEGPQGELKSSACRAIGGKWFSDNLPHLHGDAVRVSQHLRGKWLIEISELSAMSRSESDDLKAFVTRPEERFTPKYGRKEVVEQRQCVFVGTTNETKYLRDKTGGRRFWPIKIGTIRINDLTRDRDQLFAEARELYQRGYQWWPGREFEQTHILPQQDARFEEDVWQEHIAQFLLGKDRVTLSQVATEGLRLDLPKIGRQEQLRISGALTRLKWKEGKRTEAARWWLPQA